MVKRISLKLKKDCGEKAIHLIRKFELFDNNSRIKNDRRFIFIPLREKPSNELMSELRKEFNKIKVEESNFEKRKSVPNSLTDLLSGKLQPHILNQIPKSIDIIGDIAVIEMSPDIEKYRKEVGEGLLKINKNLKTVLCKAGPISTEYRVRNYEFVAGVNRTFTEHKEFGCNYFLDLDKVYFSPRLSYEHNRIASQIREGEIVVDMFGGVGPFSILIAKKVKRIKLYAIDINPNAIHFLLKNITMNKVKKKVTAIFGDARNVSLRHLQKVADRVIMNIPQESRRFINIACEVLRRKGGIIHYYAFMDDSSSIENKIEELREEVTHAGRDIKSILHSRKVKNVAPHECQIGIDAEIA